MPYTASKAERIVALVVAVAIVVFAMYLIARTEPFPDRDRAAAFRTLLSFAMAILGAVIPGFLHVAWSGGGFVIRAGGALALFVITYFAAPYVTDKLSATNYYLDQSARGEIKQVIDRLNSRFMKASDIQSPSDMKSLQEDTDKWLQEDGRNVNDVLALVRYASELHSCIAEENLCQPRRICAQVYDEIDNFYSAFHWYLIALEKHYPVTVRGARMFRACDCYDLARAKYCERYKIKEWCEYPKVCPVSVSRALLAHFK